MYNILVCDDEKDIVSALTIYLQTEGYRVCTASNGLEALEREDIHLVLMDIMMPGMDGIATGLTRLRRGDFQLSVDGDLFKARSPSPPQRCDPIFRNVPAGFLPPGHSLSKKPRR